MSCRVGLCGGSVRARRGLPAGQELEVAPPAAQRSAGRPGHGALARGGSEARGEAPSGLRSCPHLQPFIEPGPALPEPPSAAAPVRPVARPL